MHNPYRHQSSSSSSSSSSLFSIPIPIDTNNVTTQNPLYSKPSNSSNPIVRIPIPSFLATLQFFTRCKLDEIREVSRRWANEIQRATPFYHTSDSPDQEENEDDNVHVYEQGGQEGCWTRLLQRHKIGRVRIQLLPVLTRDNKYTEFWSPAKNNYFKDCPINVQPSALSLLGQHIFPEGSRKMRVSIDVELFDDDDKSSFQTFHLRTFNQLKKIGIAQKLLRLFLRINQRCMKDKFIILGTCIPPSSTGFINPKLFEQLKVLTGRRFALNASKLITWGPISPGLGRTIESIFTCPITIRCNWYTLEFPPQHPAPEWSITGFLETGRAQCLKFTSDTDECQNSQNLHTHLFAIFMSMQTSYCHVIPIIRIEFDDILVPTPTPLEFTNVSDEERGLALVRKRPYYVSFKNPRTKEEFQVAVREIATNQLHYVVFLFK